MYEKQETYWYIRSTSTDIKDGDLNTKYLHHKASQRRRRNEIKGLFNNNGKWCTEAEDLEDIVQILYKKMFTLSRPRKEACNKVLDAVHPSINYEDNVFLLRPFSKEKIFYTICEMHLCKAPGPNGIHAIFYQRFWHIIGDDVTKHVCNILHGLHSPKFVNTTNIVLIPKVKSPTRMTEFRPIASCNVLLKIVTKAIVRRLKYIPYQSHF